MALFTACLFLLLAGHPGLVLIVLLVKFLSNLLE
jgi:hypothetical protein